MKIEIHKRNDGCGVLRCTRDDGSITWQKQSARQAPHFALHDLTHFAVESTLGFRGGFYGLIAQGWEIDDATGKGVRGPIPAEAGEVEALVGALDSERACDQRWTAGEFNEMAARQASNAGRAEPRKVTETDLALIRELRSRLFEKWREVPPGGVLALDFADVTHEPQPKSTRSRL